MQCQIPDSCRFASDCQHKDVAEFCAYHRIAATTPEPVLQKFDPYDPKIDDEMYYLEEPE